MLVIAEVLKEDQNTAISLKRKSLYAIAKLCPIHIAKLQIRNEADDSGCTGKGSESFSSSFCMSRFQLFYEFLHENQMTASALEKVLNLSAQGSLCPDSSFSISFFIPGCWYDCRRKLHGESERRYDYNEIFDPFNKKNYLSY